MTLPLAARFASRAVPVLLAALLAGSPMPLFAATDMAPYVTDEMLSGCTKQMGQHLGYADSSLSQG